MLVLTCIFVKKGIYNKKNFELRKWENEETFKMEYPLITYQLSLHSFPKIMLANKFISMISYNYYDVQFFSLYKGAASRLISFRSNIGIFSNSSFGDGSSWYSFKCFVSAMSCCNSSFERLSLYAANFGLKVFCFLFFTSTFPKKVIQL